MVELELKNKRNSSIELLRIIMMFLIVYGHAVSQSALPEEVPISVSIMNIVFGSFARVCTLCFMVITGWYLKPTCSCWNIYYRCRGIWLTFSASILAAWMFCVVCLNTRFNIIIGLFPLSNAPLWYVACYIMFLGFVPFINIALTNNAVDMKTKRVAAISLFFMIYGIGTISPVTTLLSKEFPAFYSEVLVYICVYVFIQVFREKLEKIPYWVWVLTLILNILFVVVVRTVNSLYDSTGIMRILGKFVSYYFSHLETIPCLLFAVSIFMVMKKIAFQSEIINNISKCMIVIYIIHQTPTLYPLLWDDVFSVNKHTKNGLVFFVYMVFVFIVLGIVCYVLNYIIEFVKKMIMKKIIKERDA